MSFTYSIFLPKTTAVPFSYVSFKSLSVNIEICVFTSFYFMQIVVYCVHNVVKLTFSFKISKSRMEEQILVNLHKIHLSRMEYNSTITISCYYDTHNNMNDFKSIILSEWSQTQKATYWMIPFTWHSGKDQLKRKQIGGFQRPGIGGRAGDDWLVMIDFKEGWGNFLGCWTYSKIVIIVVEWPNVLKLIRVHT